MLICLKTFSQCCTLLFEEAAAGNDFFLGITQDTDANDNFSNSDCLTFHAIFVNNTTTLIVLAIVLFFYDLCWLILMSRMMVAQSTLAKDTLFVLSRASTCNSFIIDVFIDNVVIDSEVISCACQQ